MRILEEIGTDVLHDQARKLLAEAGMKVEDERVHWDRGVRDGAGREGPVVLPAAGTQPRAVPDDRRGGRRAGVDERRAARPSPATWTRGVGAAAWQDHDAFVKLTHATDVLNCVQVGAAEATTSQWKHATWTWSTRRSATRTSRTPLRHERPAARDGIRMAEIVHGGREAIEETPALHGHREPQLAR